jgi:hypothetical protein
MANEKTMTRRPDAKLTEDAVRDMRRRYEADERRHGIITELAREYGVTPATAWHAIIGLTWRWVK